MKNLRGFLNKSVLIALLLISIVLSGCSQLIEDSQVNQVNQVSVDGELRVHFIDVGQADAVLIQQINLDSSKNMLIDAGNNSDGEYLVDYLKNQGVESLDYVIGTHPHADHIGGLDDIINSFPIEILLMPKVISNTRTFEEVMDAVADNGLRVTTPVVGTKYTLGDAEFTILAPNSEEYQSLNDYSIASRLVYGENSFIFTGDAESLSEYEILDEFNKEFLNSDVLKVPHHGSSSSTADEFLEAVSPKYGVISSGLDNSYGHPHREIIAKLTKENVEILRTDQQGTIIITSDGKNLSMNTVIDLSVHGNTNDILITGLDKIGELVTINNTGDSDVDITGWKLVSVRGNQEFIFPNYILKAGFSVTVGGYDSRNISDFIWEIGGGVWSNSQSDPAELYDPNGNLISTFED
ncbi:MAG: MBL fold metallo-hydrolase [Tissierellaceae bacterium]|nr:MBL fold metallo-hydrolase [Tissierellaceae bacterium]